MAGKGGGIQEILLKDGKNPSVLLSDDKKRLRRGGSIEERDDTLSRITKEDEMGPGQEE